MINVFVNGCNGRMGRTVISQIENFKNLKLVGGFDIKDDSSSNFPIFTDYRDINIDIDVIIDFSYTLGTLNLLKYASMKKIPVVIATTGFSEDQEKLIKEYSNQIAIFKSANMSFDINLMAKIVSEVAKKLSDSDIEIVETHHNQKKDAPSGTALLLANAINDVFDEKKEYVFDRHSKTVPRSKNEIGFSSIRGGNIVGEHTVQFFSPFETLEIKHTSYSRNVFADGALRAAEFLSKQKPGFYDMNNLI
jgi:4-hydroxy-tetrahydrodipicolinate reductase